MVTVIWEMWALALAHARKARRPSGSRAAQVQDPFADPSSALAFLNQAW